MKVRLLSARAGDGFSHGHGEIIDLSDKEAAAHIDAGLAEPVRDEEIETTDLQTPEDTSAVIDTETATLPPVETTSRRRGRRNQGSGS